MKRAVILAAGLGKRLGNLTKDIPKCLLVVEPESKKTLLDFLLSALSDNGINEIIIVTGFAEEALKKHISTNWSDKFSVHYIFNDKFSDYNNIYSAYLARNVWDDETVLLNSDIIFHPDILRNLYREDSRGVLQYASTSFLIVDNSKTLTSESMKTEIDKEGKIRKINKNLDIKTSFGEYIGITYLRGSERVKFLKSLEKNVKEKRFDIYYEDALADILSDSSVFPCSTLSMPWTEVDTEEDLSHAREIAKKINNLATANIK